MQWVLHGVPPEGGEVAAVVLRGAAEKTLSLVLAPGWRAADDISWRASTWGLRRVALGGMKLATLRPEDRARLGLPKKALGLRVEHVGQHAPHDAAKRAGFRKGDVLVSFAGRTDLSRETDLLRHALLDLRPGTDVAVVLRRGDEDLTLHLAVGR